MPLSAVRNTPTLLFADTSLIEPLAHVSLLQVYFVDGGTASKLDIDRALPGGWLETVDAASGQSYFYRPATHQVTWDKPSACAGRWIYNAYMHMRMHAHLLFSISFINTCISTCIHICPLYVVTRVRMFMGAGELLLQTQLKAWTAEYAYLPVPPVPGTLWLFPGYMPHAVLPRAKTMDSSSLRISVACNISSEHQIADQ